MGLGTHRYLSPYNKAGQYVNGIGGTLSLSSVHHYHTLVNHNGKCVPFY